MTIVGTEAKFSCPFDTFVHFHFVQHKRPKRRASARARARAHTHTHTHTHVILNYMYKLSDRSAAQTNRNLLFNYTLHSTNLGLSL